VARAVLETPPSLAEKAYSAIRQMIVSLELRPGAVISEPQLMAQLEIGRTPVREALRRLAQEKLIEVYPRRAMFVTSVDVRDLARLCEVRVTLESEAARLAAERSTDADREELAVLIEELDRHERLDGRGLIDFDERIHRAIYRCTKNRFLEETAEEYYVLALRIWYLALDQAQELEGAVQEHRPLLEAIRKGDGERAQRLMRKHVEGFERVMRRVLLAV
jgi:GntR family transcriptional regulator, rspAB operon transcriptional repressor